MAQSSSVSGRGGPPVESCRKPCWRTQHRDNAQKSDGDGLRDIALKGKSRVFLKKEDCKE
jgi:hypothetical protein